MPITPYIDESLSSFPSKLKTTHNNMAGLLTMMYWLRYEIIWVYINSENYLNMTYLWCYELPPSEEVTSLSSLHSDRLQK